MSSGGRMEFEVGFGTRRQAQRSATGDDDTRSILVAADFSGRTGRGANETLAGRHTYRVDSDTCAAVFAGFESRIRIPMPWAAGGALELGFESPDDFHPDALLARVPALAELLACRRALDTPAAGTAAEKLQQLLGVTAPAPESSPTDAPTPVVATETAEDTLARLMGAPPSGAGAAATPMPAATEVHSLIRQIVGTSSSVAAREPAAKGALVAAAELALTERLRAILHHPAFKALETTWRGLDFLVRRCPDEERVHLHACDATPDEIAADPAGLVRILRSGGFKVLVLDATFGNSPADLAGLGAVAGACHAEGVTLAAGAHAGLVGCDNFDAHPDPDDWTHEPAAGVREGWTAFRALPQARTAVLAAPRFLARQPYGKAGDPIAAFPFEELPSPAGHEDFAWANPGFLVAQALAVRFADAETTDAREAEVELDGLPVARFIAHEGTAIMPCAEAWLSDRAARRILEHQLCAVQSVRNSDAVRVVLPA